MIPSNFFGLWLSFGVRNCVGHEKKMRESEMGQNNMWVTITKKSVGKWKQNTCIIIIIYILSLLCVVGRLFVSLRPCIFYSSIDHIKQQQNTHKYQSTQHPYAPPPTHKRKTNTKRAPTYSTAQQNNPEDEQSHEPHLRANSPTPQQQQQQQENLRARKMRETIAKMKLLQL